MDKTEIIAHIHTLVSHNVIGNKQLMSRYKGFRGELSFETFLRSKYKNYQLLDGGMIFSLDSSKSSLNNSIYITITNASFDLDEYRNLYKHLSKLGFEKMFFVSYDQSNWEIVPVMKFPKEIISLPIPDLEFLEYDMVQNSFEATTDQISIFTDLFDDMAVRKKSRHAIKEESKTYLETALMKNDWDDLIKIYMNRLFLDGFIGFGKDKGKISDIDLILKRPDGEYVLIEIKEKDLAKKIVGFGLDLPRIDDMNRILKDSNLAYYLVVRHINNQRDRKLVGWKMISIADFSKGIEGQKPTAGGTGMRSSTSYNPTLICEESLFQEI